MGNEEVKSLELNKTIWDNQVKGLHVRHRRNGRRVFYLYYRTRDGQQRRPRLGDVGSMSLTDARKVARELLAAVSAGQDPKVEWLNGRAEPTTDILFKRVWDEHWNKERYLKSGWAKEALRNYTNHIAPVFGRDKISELSPLKIRNWHGKFKEKEKTITGNRCLEILSKMFQFAEEQELIPQRSNPCKLVKAFTEKTRSRYASEDELRKIFAIFQREAIAKNREIAFLCVLIFSGARPRDIERGNFRDVQEFQKDESAWGLLEFCGKAFEKTGVKDKILIPPFALKLIKGITPTHDGTLTGIKMPVRFWNEVRKEAGCPDLWARDLRRTFATIGLSNGVGADIIGEVQNHHSAQTRLIYQKLLPDAKLDAVQEISNAIEEIIK